MKGKGKGGILGVATLVVLVVTSMASAATPSEIYADYADNGRLDATYSTSDLENALDSAVIQGYGNPILTPGFKTEAEQAIDQNTETTGEAGTLPFTGVDLALLTAGGIALLLLGWGFRRFGKARS